MQNELAALHAHLVLVLEIDQHRDQPAAVIEVYRTVVAAVGLVEIEAGPELVRLVRRTAKLQELFVGAVLAVRHVDRFVQVDAAAFTRPIVAELGDDVLDPPLTMDEVVDPLPGGAGGEMGIVLRIAPIERLPPAFRALHFRDLGEVIPQLLVELSFEKAVDHEMRERLGVELQTIDSENFANGDAHDWAVPCPMILDSLTPEGADENSLSRRGVAAGTDGLAAAAALPFYHELYTHRCSVRHCGLLAGPPASAPARRAEQWSARYGLRWSRHFTRRIISAGTRRMSVVFPMRWRGRATT